MIAGWRMWDELHRQFRDAFGDMAQAVNYITSHVVEKEGEQRFMNFIFGDLLRLRWLGDGSVDNVRYLVNNLATVDQGVRAAHEEALDRVGSAFALLMTAVGIPMFLAGEEFGDVHDLDHSDWRLKMSDPVDWGRRQQTLHSALWERVRELIRLRTSCAALQRNEVNFFYFHPTIDENDGVRVFAYCRTGGRPLGSPDQVVVVANCGAQDFPAFDFPWPWADSGRIRECGIPLRGNRPQFRPDQRQVTISLAPFQVRVFCT
jgi:1,4-alpha-glucan branching enzyme